MLKYKFKNYKSFKIVQVLIHNIFLYKKSINIVIINVQA